MSELHERVAKLEARADHLEDKTDNHEQIIMNLHDDIQELRNELGSKLDRVVDKAMDTVPPWFAKFVVTISLSLVFGVFGLHYYHVI